MLSSHRRPVGQFVWNTTTGQWQWDAAMYEIHGYSAGVVDVSSELVLQHKQEEHRSRAAEVLKESAAADLTFSNYHGIVDAKGQQRTVLSVGVSHADTSRPGFPYRYCRGFMIDVTHDENDVTHRAVTRSRQSAASIQQSMGLLMGSLGLSEEAAFAVMSRVSQHHNVKLRDLARGFMQAAVAGGGATSRQDLSRLLVDQAVALAASHAREQRP